MKRWVWILGALLLMMGGTSGDRRLENLRPVQLLYIWKNGSCVQVETDLGDRGEGRNLRSALEQLRETAPGVVLTDTAEQVVIHAADQELWEEAAVLLRPSAEVFLSTGSIEPEKAAAFLRSRACGTTLRQLRIGEKTAPILKEEKGRYEIRS